MRTNVHTCGVIMEAAKFPCFIIMQSHWCRGDMKLVPGSVTGRSRRLLWAMSEEVSPGPIVFPSGVGLVGRAMCSRAASAYSRSNSNTRNNSDKKLFQLTTLGVNAERAAVDIALALDRAARSRSDAAGGSGTSDGDRQGSGKRRLHLGPTCVPRARTALEYIPT